MNYYYLQSHVTHVLWLWLYLLCPAYRSSANDMSDNPEPYHLSAANYSICQSEMSIMISFKTIKINMTLQFTWHSDLLYETFYVCRFNICSEMIYNISYWMNRMVAQPVTGGPSMQFTHHSILTTILASPQQQTPDADDLFVTIPLRYSYTCFIRIEVNY